MKVMRNHTTLKKMTKQDDCYVDASPQERIAFMWELTAELWSLKDKDSVERRLQRNVTNLIKNKESTGREKEQLDAKYLRENHDS
jgi:hypothetical protein